MSQSSGHRPVWVDLASQDAAASRAFYAALFGWVAEPSPDPQFGGYAVATKDGKDVAGISPAQSPGQPTAWSVYIGTDDAAATAAAVAAHGGTVVAPPFPVGEMGTMAVFQDPAGAFICCWQTNVMGGFAAEGDGTVGWTELNVRGLDGVVPFYSAVFGWGSRRADMPSGPYVEFTDGETGVAGAMEMPPMVPAEVPSYWLVYFTVTDLGGTLERATGLGASIVLPVTSFTGGTFAILRDPQGAVIGLYAG